MRRTYRYNPETKELEEVGTARGERYHMVMGDIKEYVSPVTGQLISTRSQHRAHLRKHNMAPSEDFKGTLEKARRERQLRRAGVHPEQRKERVAALRDAWEHHRNQERARSRYG